MKEFGTRFVFVSRQSGCPSDDPLFEKDNFGVLLTPTGEDAYLALVTDWLGKTIWWRPETVFLNEILILARAPLVPRSRIPIPYGDLVGQPT